MGVGGKHFRVKSGLFLRLNGRRSRISRISQISLFYRDFMHFDPTRRFFSQIALDPVFLEGFANLTPSPDLAKIACKIDPISTRGGIIEVFILPPCRIGISRACSPPTGPPLAANNLRPSSPSGQQSMWRRLVVILWRARSLVTNSCT
jgi:hypothetical protein